MIKILFVCHGNICRSPMAEYVLKHLAERAGVADRFYIDSAAVSPEELGSAVYGPARRTLARHGVFCGDHRARVITRQDCEKFDLIYYMDRSNARYLARMFPGKTKFFPLLSRDVADPWYSGDFEATWEDILEGCVRILREQTGIHLSPDASF